ncbi:MAG: proline--tRNA ligase [Acidobacteria bacterium]|nr:proline--tRNA ligase [Acidobacteriota bacterium]MBV9477252.1 proline--tRNA ligase [Acidobacteriota bacterium]
MRWSRFFINTLREVPADAEVVSQRLMMRAGMIRKVAAGIYTYLPLGLRSIQKMEAIVRDEMNRAGASELLMPSIQPAELWMESGRWQKYGKELLRIKDRHDRDFVFGPTHEEVITDTVRDAINSYRQLPINLYQIQTKFRDEVRPRFGLMRGREFIMKDAYSFHTTRESLDETYDVMRDAYSRIFHRCSLDHVPVEADTGNIGGSASHEFMVLAQSGEDAVVSCPNCRYGANVEKATSKFFDDEVEPAPSEVLAELHTPGTQSIDDVGAFLNKPTSQLIKTLVFDTDLGPVMVLVRGDRAGNEIKIKNHLGAQWMEMLSDTRFEETTGGPIGYCGPVGTKCARVLADHSLRGRKRWIVGGNRKDMHYDFAVPGRDFPEPEFGDFTTAIEGDPCVRCGTPLEIYRGIEVGHIFKLGTKYSEAMQCTFLDESGQRQPMVMGCYGLGIGRTVASAIEQSHDDDGIIWPMPIAPFEVVVTSVGKDEAVLRTATEVYEKLKTEGIDVLFDDRDERPGVKFKDADLIGFPLRIAVGAKSLANGQIEWSFRKDRAKQLGAPDEVLARVVEAVRAGLS